MNLTQTQFNALATNYLATNVYEAQNSEDPAFKLANFLPEAATLYAYLRRPDRIEIMLSGGTKTVDGVKTRPVHHSRMVELQPCKTPIDVIREFDLCVRIMIQDIIDNPTKE